MKQQRIIDLFSLKHILDAWLSHKTNTQLLMEINNLIDLKPEF